MEDKELLERVNDVEENPDIFVDSSIVFSELGEEV